MSYQNKETNEKPSNIQTIPSKVDIDKRQGSKSPRLSIIQLFRYATTSEKIQIVIALLLTVSTGVIRPISIVFYGKFITKVTERLQQNQLQGLQEVTQPLVIYIFCMGAIIIVLSYIGCILWIKTGANQTRRIRRLYLRSLLRKDMSWFDHAKEGSLSIRLTSDTQLFQEGISEKIGMCAFLISQFITGFVVALTTDYRMTLIMFSTFPILGVTSFVSTKYTRNAVIETQAIYADSSTIVEQALQAIRTVYSLTLQKCFLALYRDKLLFNYRSSVKQDAAMGLGTSIFLLFFYSSLGLALWYGTKLVIQGESTGSSVLVVFLVMVKSSSVVNALPANLMPVITACGAAQKLFEVIEEEPSIMKRKSNNSMILKKVSGSIRLDNVSFAYPSRPGTNILSNLSMHIPAGKTVAFVGPSGSGKSTIAQLIQRLYDVDKGSLSLDGTDIRSLDVEWLRETIGIVRQEPVLFNTSIRQNICLGHYSDETQLEKDMIRACKEANCHSFISQLPMGYDTVIGEQGCMLSGGQKQRIAIARAILRNPSILILDEATSALDLESENLVQSALERASKNRTTIVIAHRLATVMNADAIVVLDNGQIVEKGTHNELIGLQGVYHRLVEIQAIETNTKTNHQSSDCTSKCADDSPIDKASDCSETLYNSPQSSRLTATREVDLYSKNLADSAVMKVDQPKEKKLNNYNDHKEQKSKNQYPSLRALQQMRPEWPLVIVGTIGCIIEGCISPLYAYSFSSVTATLSDPAYAQQLKESPGQSFLKAPKLLSLILLIGLSAFIGSFLRSFFNAISEARYVYRLRCQLFSAYLKQEVGYFDEKENNIGSLASKLAVDTQNAGRLITKVWCDILTLLTAMIVGLLIAMLHSWQLSLSIFILTAIIVVINAVDIWLHRSYYGKVKKANTESDKVASEVIREVRTVVSLNRQYFFERLYQETLEYPYQLAIKRAYLIGIGFSFPKGINIFASAVGFYVGAALITAGVNDFNQIFVSMNVMIATAATVGQKLTFASHYAKGQDSMLSINKVVERKSSVDTELEGYEPATESVEGNISYKEIFFAYPTRPSNPVFTGNFNLTCCAGQTIALVGPSGCGKSTAIGMLQRWYDAESGAVTLDDRNVKSYSVHALRQHQALVAQEPILFDFSISDNIRFGVEEGRQVSQQDIEDACRASNIHDFITNLPDGYDTRVGDKGSQLSGGQKQRIAIARALIRKPKVLLLDEATSALDSENEKVVQEAINNIIQEGGRTIITIAHRLSAIKNADLICVVKDGRVIEQGSHEDLLRMNGVYSEMAKKQSLAST